MESGTPFLESIFFPEKVWNVKHAKSFWSEKKSVLCSNMASAMELNNRNN